MNAILAPSAPLELAYNLGLRRWVDLFQRRRFEGGDKRVPLPEFETVKDAWAYLDAWWEWGSDRERGSWWSDWSSHPEVLHARLLAGGDDLGDCDDYAAFMCAAIAPLVDRVMRLSVWTFGKGHTVCVFEHNGQLYVIDYEIVDVATYEDAVELIQRRYNYGAVGWVWETPALDLLAVAPRHPAKELTSG